MGLLDEAIREHLDLKRRRGADPEEIERAEQEALGPVRRAPDEAAVAEAPPDEQPPAYDHEGEDDWEEQFGEHAEEPLAAEGHPPEPAEHEPFPAAEASPAEEPPAADKAPVFEEPPPPADEPALPATEHVEHEEEPPPEEPPHAEPPPAEPPPAPAEHPPEHASEETVEYDVEGALDEDRQKHEDDVLEETPEFLQDTPDHDRLWFEQKPPKDFDFNE